MNVTNAAYDILTGDANVSALVANSGNVNEPYRVFLGYARNGETKPFIVFRTALIDETQTKSGASDLDTWRLELDIYHTTHLLGATLANYCRTALEAYKGTINGVIVQGCRIDGFETDQDIDNLPIWTMDLTIRVAT